MSNPQARTPRELLRMAGSLTSVAAALAAATLASAQTGQPDPAPHQVKADPAMVQAAARAVEALTTPAAAPVEQPKPSPDSQVKVTEQMTVDLHVKDESVNNVLELLSLQSKKNIIASKNVSGKVSADLFNVTFHEALDAILHVNGFQYIEKGNFIYVYTREEFIEIQKSLSKRVAKVMRLNYLNAGDAESFVKPLLSQGGDIKTAIKTPEFSVGADAPTGKDDYALGAVLVVIDYEENIAAVEKLLIELDTRPSQVLVEATILETRVTEANAFGIDLSIIGDIDFFDFVGVGGPRRAADALIRGGTGASTGVSPADNAAGAVSTSAGNTQDGRSTVKVGVIAGPVGVFLRALDDVADFTVLSSPKLLALNRMPARVLVGQRVGYLNTTATETSTTQTVDFLDTGTTLYFRPFVADTGEIRMELKPKVASATVRDAGNGQGGIVSIPDETTQEITTNVLVKDGNTIVLGGLFVERTDSSRKQVPFFGDIPFIGAAFRGHDDSTDRRELIFLIRPSIMNETALAMQGVDIKNEIERIRAGQRQGLLPWSREKMTSALNVEAETAARAGNTEEALWKIQRSLSLNPRQPDALRLREKITAEHERWPSMYILDGIITGEVRERIDSVPTVPGSRHRVPFGSVDLPRRAEPVDGHAGEELPGAMSGHEGAGTAPAAEPAADPHAEDPANEQPATTTAQAPEPQASAAPIGTGAAPSTSSAPAPQPLLVQAHAPAAPETSVAAVADQPVGPGQPVAATNGGTPAEVAATPADQAPVPIQPVAPASGWAAPQPAAVAAPMVDTPPASPMSLSFAARMNMRSFFEALFLGPTRQPGGLAETPADQPHKDLEISK